MSSIRILIVEDDRRKAELIATVLCEVPTVSAESIQTVSSIITAKRAVSADAYDLLLLDIQLPWRDGERPEPHGGLKLWQSIRGRSDYKRPAHVIGLTAYPDTQRELAAVLEEENWLLVQYDDSSTAWRDQVSKKVEHILALKAQAVDDQKQFTTSAVVVTAVDIEREAIRSLPYEWSPDQSEHCGACYRGEFPTNGSGTGKVVSITAHQMGMPAAACLALVAISEFRPRYLIMAGVAAGVRGKANLGDILVADPSWDWGSGKLALEKGNRIFQPDPRPLRVPYELVATCQQIGADHEFLAAVRNNWKGGKPDTVLKLHVGPMASGAAVVSDPSVIEEIKLNSRKLVGIDMETYGVYYAGYVCSGPKPSVLSVKSVCDYADEEKDDRFQDYAAYTSAAVVQALLERHLAF